MIPTKSISPKNFNFLAQFKVGIGGGEEHHLFKVKKGKPPTSSLLIDLGDGFLGMLYNFGLTINWLKKVKQISIEGVKN